MSDLSLIPLQDGYETQLSQDWDGNTGTVYVLSTPSYTPTTTNTYIVVNPGKPNMQIAEITDYDSTAKTLTVSSISFEKGLGISSTAQSHSTGSEVIISNNYQFWVDIQTAINTKLDDTGGTMTGLLQFTGTTHAGIKLLSLTTTQRDALSASNGMIIYNSTTGELNQYIGGAWSAVAAGSTQPTASTTVLGKIKTDVTPAGDPVALIQDNPKYDALAGTSGTPSSSNKYVTNDDTATAATANKVARRLAGGNITVVTESQGNNSTNAASTAYVDATLPKLSISTSNVTVSNTTSETDLVSVAVPANTLGTANGIRAKLFVSSTGNQGADVLALKFKYGATTIATISNIDAQNLTLNGYIECILLGAGTTSSQEGTLLVELFEDNTDATAVANGRIRNLAMGTATEDSTGALNFVVTAQFSGAGAPSANDTITVSQIIIEKIK